MVEDDIGPESTREVSAEDFLYHLYRGNELLQDDRVQEAKQELEHALALQPRDAKGQDLLAIVYFRLGLYPRAITIYEALIGMYPDATTPRINLALCYLKTGQAGSARAELERVIQKDPQHTRAWGYLGLAFQRLGDVDRAIAAFETGGQHGMARRVADLAQSPPTLTPLSMSARALSTPEREAVSRTATEAFDELDRSTGQAFRAEASNPDRGSASGTWAAVEPGRELPGVERRSFMPSLAPSDSLPPPIGSLRMPPIGVLPPDDAGPTSAAPPGPESVGPRPITRAPQPAELRDPTATLIPPSSTIPSAYPPAATPPPTALDFAREHMLVFARDHAVSHHASGFVLVHCGSGLAARFDAIRAVSYPSSLTTRPLLRKNRGRDAEEPLGSASAPLLVIEGAGQVVLGPPAGTKLCPMVLGDELLTVRESALIALEGEVAYENARLPGGDGDFVSLVQLRGAGSATLALPPQCAAIEVLGGRALLLRVHSVLGWIGRITPRAVPPSEAPTKTRGLVALSGEGMVLVDGR